MQHMYYNLHMFSAPNNTEKSTFLRKRQARKLQSGKPAENDIRRHGAAVLTRTTPLTKALAADR